MDISKLVLRLLFWLAVALVPAPSGTFFACDRYFADDFDDGDLWDCDPVCWEERTGVPGFIDARGGDLVIYNTGFVGKVVTVPSEVFEGSVSVRARVSFRDLDQGPVEARAFVGANAQNLTGYIGDLWWTGEISIGRAPGDGSCCARIAPPPGEPAAFLQDFELYAEYWIQLDIAQSPSGADLAMWAWKAGEERPGDPQLLVEDPIPYLSGTTGLGFRHLPERHLSKGVFHVWEVSDCSLPPPEIPGEGTVGPFLRGDCDGDGGVAGTVTDAVFFLAFNFLGGREPPCAAACDANGDGALDISDAVYALIYNFSGGSAPPAPFPACGRSSVLGDLALGCSAATAGKPPACP